MLKVSVSIIIISLFALCIWIGNVAIDVYDVLKLINHETDVDKVNFRKCVLPYEV